MGIQEHSVKVILTRVKQILIRATPACHVLIFSLRQTYLAINVVLARAVSQETDPNVKVRLIIVNPNITLTFGFRDKITIVLFFEKGCNFEKSRNSTSF